MNNLKPPFISSIVAAIRNLWNRLPDGWKRHICSALQTFVASALLLMGAQIQLGFPKSWVEFGALLMVVARGAFKITWEMILVKSADDKAK